MGKQMLWVLRTYLSNKLFLVALAFASIMFVAVLGSSPSRKSIESNLPADPRGRLIVNSVESLENVRRMHLQNEVDELDLAQLWADMNYRKRGPVGVNQTPPVQKRDASPVPFDILREFPNLRYVHISVPTAQIGVTMLANPQGIRYLDAGTLQDLAPLAAMRDLERLDLTLADTTNNISALASLPKLKTLFVWNNRFLDGRTLAEIAGLPHLECLVIQSSLKDPMTTEAALAELAHAPQLRSLYIGPPWGPPESELLAEARAALPNLDVRPAVDIVRAPWFVGIAPAFLAMAVGGIMATQFRNPASRLSPSFLRAHGAVGAVWLTIVVTAVLICGRVGRHPLPASLLFATGITGCMFGAGVDMAKRNILGPTMTFSRLDKLLGFGILLVVPLLFVPVGWKVAGVPHTAQSYLELVDALTVYGFAVVGAGFAWRAHVDLRTIAGATSTLGNGPGRSQTAFQRGSFFAEGALEFFLDGWRLAAYKPSLWNRVLRWRVGNPRLYPVFFLAISAVVTAIVYYFLKPTQQPSPAAYGVFPIVVLFTLCSQIFTIWRQRLCCLEVESLRPISRYQLQRDWAVAVICDLFPLVLMTGILVTLSIHLRGDWYSALAWRALLQDWPRVLGAMALYTGTLWLASLAVTSTFIVIERLWLGFVIGFGSLLLGGGTLAALSGVFSRTTRGAAGAYDILPLLWVPTIVSLMVIACMWRLWTRMDFDRRA